MHSNKMGHFNILQTPWTDIKQPKLSQNDMQKIQRGLPAKKVFILQSFMADFRNDYTVNLEIKFEIQSLRFIWSTH